MGTTLLLMGAMLLGLLVFWGLRTSRPSSTIEIPVPAQLLALRPAETSRGAATYKVRAGWVQRHPLTSPELRAYHVPVGDPRERHHGLTRVVNVPPSAFLPRLDEAPWTRGETVKLLQDALEMEAAGGNSDVASEAFVASAQRARLDPTKLEIAQDPWRALLALEAERRRSLAQVTSEQESAAVGRWMLRLAEEVLTVHAGTAVADHAWMYRLHAVGSREWDTFDQRLAGQLGVEALQASKDRLVSAVATGHIERATSASSTLLPALEQLWADGHTDLWFASAAVNHALHRERWDAAEEWVARLHDRVELQCQPPAGTQDTPTIRKPTCQAWGQDLDWVWAQVRAVQGTEATTYKEQLALSAWRCHLWGSSRRDGSETRVSGRFDGEGWTWRAWTGADREFDACFEAEMYFGVRPKKAVGVEVVVMAGI